MKNNIKKMVINGIMNAIANMSITDIMMLDSMLDAIVIKAIANRVPAPAPTTDSTPIERYIKLAQDIVSGSDDECANDYDEREAELNEREAELDARELELDNREDELAEREEELNFREEELNIREEEMKNLYGSPLDADDAEDVSTDNVADVRDVITNLIGSIVSQLGGRR